MVQSIVITGASQGIGAATARAFLGAGWNVGLMARNRTKLEAVADGWERAMVLEADVTDLAAVEAGFGKFVAEAGRLDVLFNNAGIGNQPLLIDEVEPETWANVLAVNLGGMFNCAREAFSQMRRQSPQGGRIINNGSVSAHAPRWRSLPYTTTKHGVTGMTKSLSLDGRPYNIACGQIDIGNALTEMTAGFGDGQPQADGSLMGEPTMDVDHVGRAVLQMAELPLEANVQFMTIMASGMPMVGRG